jgi:ketosteroid isomerase-like protein
MELQPVAGSPVEVMMLFAERMARGDLEGLLALYEPSAAFEPEPGVVVRGVDEIRPALAALAALRPSIVSGGEPSVVAVGEVALVSNRWTLTASLPDGGTVRQGGVSADVVRRQADGRLLVLIDHPRGASVPA